MANKGDNVIHRDGRRGIVLDDAGSVQWHDGPKKQGKPEAFDMNLMEVSLPDSVWGGDKKASLGKESAGMGFVTWYGSPAVVVSTRGRVAKIEYWREGGHDVGHVAINELEETDKGSFTALVESNGFDSPISTLTSRARKLLDSPDLMSPPDQEPLSEEAEQEQEVFAFHFGRVNKIAKSLAKHGKVRVHKVSNGSAVDVYDKEGRKIDSFIVPLEA